MANTAADRWASATATAREIVDVLDWEDGELLSEWASEREDETRVECGEQVAAEIRQLLPDGWTTSTDERGLVLRRVES